MQNECTAKAEGNQLYTTELIWQKKKIEVFAKGGAPYAKTGSYIFIINF